MRTHRTRKILILGCADDPTKRDEEEREKRDEVRSVLMNIKQGKF